jgi:ribosome-associated translation inhibitor RaiA
VATSDGLYIKWRETAPDRGVLDFALAQLEGLHTSWPETVQCNIVIERAPSVVECTPGATAAQLRYSAQLTIELNRRGMAVKAKATGDDPYAAIRCAFGDLRNCMPTSPRMASGRPAPEAAA